jgi:hypothetical protein
MPLIGSALRANVGQSLCKEIFFLATPGCGAVRSGFKVVRALNLWKCNGSEP